MEATKTQPFQKGDRVRFRVFGYRIVVTGEVTHVGADGLLTIHGSYRKTAPRDWFAVPREYHLIEKIEAQDSTDCPGDARE